MKTMNQPAAGVLFVGVCPFLSESLTQTLHARQCEYRYVASCEEALVALNEGKFRVVLSKIKLVDGSGRRLIPATQRASGWLLLSFPVENGSWWIPVVEGGKLPVRAMAMHSREFSKVLLRIVTAIMADPLSESAAERECLERSKHLQGD